MESPDKKNFRLGHLRKRSTSQPILVNEAPSTATLFKSKFSGLQNYLKEKKKTGHIGGSLLISSSNADHNDDEKFSLGDVGKSTSLHEIKRRITFDLSKSLKIQGDVFEDFLIVGINPQKEVNEKSQPEILYHHSTQLNSSLNELPRFCFPHGAKVKKVARSIGNSSHSDLNEVLYSPLSVLENSEHSYVILLTTETGFLYGVCVQFKTTLSGSCSLVSNKSEGKNPSEEYIVPLCFCFVSKTPLIEFFFKVLYSFCRIEREISLFPLEENEESPLRTLLQELSEKRLPKEGSDLEVHLPSRYSPIAFTIKHTDGDTLLEQTCLSALFKTLSLKTFLDLLTALLTERQVIIQSKYLGLLSASTFAIIPLLKPFVVQGAYIPIVPENLQMCLQAPVPYVMGTLPLSEHQISELNHCFIIDLDSEKTYYPKVPLAVLPLRRMFENQLKPHYEKLFCESNKRESTFRKPFDYGHQHQDHITGLLHIIKLWMGFLCDNMKMLSNFSKHFAWDSTSRQKELLSLVESYNRDFCQEFWNTQLWSTHVEKRFYEWSYPTEGLLPEGFCPNPFKKYKI